MGSIANHNDGAEDADLYVGKTVIVRNVPTAPSIDTLVDMLGWLIMHGNLRKNELYKRSTVSYSQFKNYIAWMKWKDLIAHDDSHIAINERGRTLYGLLA